MSRTFRIAAALLLLLALTATVPASAKRAADADLAVSAAASSTVDDGWWSTFVAFRGWLASLFDQEHGAVVP
jgi:hypothetical protein